MLKTGPQEVAAGTDAQEADQGHPDAGYHMNAALGEGTDAAPALLTSPTAAQEGVEAEGEGDEPGEGEEQARG